MNRRERYPAIVDFCNHWSNTPMLQQTFSAFEESYKSGNDGCIDAAKGLVECACMTLVEALDDPNNPIKQWEDSPLKNSNLTTANWVTAVVRLLKLSVDKHHPFNKVISQHYKTAIFLSEYRNDHGPLSHGKNGFLSILSDYHRDGAVVATNAIIGFLHSSYLSTEPDIINTHEPYSFFQNQNELIDNFSYFNNVSIDLETKNLKVELVINRDNQYSIILTPSQLLFGVDKELYKEVLEAVQSQSSLDEDEDEHQ